MININVRNVFIIQMHKKKEKEHEKKPPNDKNITMYTSQLKTSDSN